MESIILTVVTISFNDLKGLQLTCKSIWDSNIHGGLEHIIVDGGSEDGTLKFLRENQDRFQKVIIGKDEGIFDAMNIGANLANGSFTVFMNSGDAFYEDAVSIILEESKEYCDAIYGNNIVHYPSKNFSRTRHAASPNQIYSGIWCSHQALIVKTKLLLQHPFNFHEYPNGADTEFAFWLACNPKIIFRRIDKVLAIVQAEGNSDIKRIESLNEIHRIRKIYFSNRQLRNSFLYFTELLMAKAKILVKQILPNVWLVKIYKFKYYVR